MSLLAAGCGISWRSSREYSSSVIALFIHYAAVLIGRIMGVARLSVSLSLLCGLLTRKQKKP